MASPEEALKAGLASLFQSKDFADFTITCGPHTFDVHKAVVCAQSEYFRAACKNFKESESNAIDLKVDESDPTCDDPEAVKHMVHYLYHLDYKAEPFELVQTENAPSTPSTAKGSFGKKKEKKKSGSNSTSPSSTGSDGNTLVHARVFACAVKYQIPALRELAASKFDVAVEANAQHPTFAEAILVAYTTTADDARELRDTIAQTLTTKDELLDIEQIEAAVLSIDKLAFELLRQKRQKAAPKQSTRMCQCPGRFNGGFGGGFSHGFNSPGDNRGYGGSSNSISGTRCWTCNGLL